MPGTLFVVATPIGNLEDITVRALRVLREVSLIAAEDTRRTARLLARYAISTPTTSLHEHNEYQKLAPLIARLQNGESVAIVSDAGTPTISDPGGWLIRAAITAGIRIEPIPGASAALAALSASGAPTDCFVFLGFPPTRSKDRSLWFERLGKMDCTVIFFEAPHRLESTLRQLKTTVGDIDICIARELTKAHEQLVRGPISSVTSELASSKGEFTIIALIGQVKENTSNPPVTGDQLILEIGQLRDSTALTRREIIVELARRHSLSTNEIYRTIERTKPRSNDADTST